MGNINAAEKALQKWVESLFSNVNSIDKGYVDEVDSEKEVRGESVELDVRIDYRFPIMYDEEGAFTDEMLNVYGRELSSYFPKVTLVRLEEDIRVVPYDEEARDSINSALAGTGFYVSSCFVSTFDNQEDFELANITFAFTLIEKDAGSMRTIKKINGGIKSNQDKAEKVIEKWVEDLFSNVTSIDKGYVDEVYSEEEGLDESVDALVMVEYRFPIMYDEEGAFTDEMHSIYAQELSKYFPITTLFRQQEDVNIVPYDQEARRSINKALESTGYSVKKCIVSTYDDQEGAVLATITFGFYLIEKDAGSMRTRTAKNISRRTKSDQRAMRRYSGKQENIMGRYNVGSRGVRRYGNVKATDVEIDGDECERIVKGYLEAILNQAPTARLNDFLGSGVWTEDENNDSLVVVAPISYEYDDDLADYLERYMPTLYRGDNGESKRMMEEINHAITTDEDWPYLICTKVRFQRIPGEEVLDDEEDNGQYVTDETVFIRFWLKVTG